MKISKRIIAWIVCFVCCAALLTGIIPGNAAAAESIRVHGDGELTIDYQYEGKSVAGAQFQIYRVADLSAEGEMTLAGAFAEYPVEMNGLTSDEFQAAAHTLYGYALLDNVKPDHTAVTGQDGMAKLDDLPVGVYLVAAQDVEMEGGKLICDPMLVTLPSKVSQEDDWNYILTIKPKCEFEEDEEEKEPKKIKVLKRWVDGGSKERPASVTVYLLRNGVVHDTVVLSKENNWRHTWEDLDPDAHWMVVEKIPEDYLVTIHKYGITYVINNYREPEITIPTIPSIPTEPEETTIPTEPEETTAPTEPEETTVPTEPEETTVPTEPEETTVPTEPEETTVPTEPEPTEPDIPQTGMLWWPVPLLAVAGLILMLVGVLLRRRSHEDA